MRNQSQTLKVTNPLKRYFLTSPLNFIFLNVEKILNNFRVDLRA